MIHWRREPLNWMLAKRFSRVIREEDRIECLASGHSPYQSIEWAINFGGGDCWAVMENDGMVPVGVYGWTQQGAIWSYWRDLDPDQVRELMHYTPPMIREMVERANAVGLPKLANLVWEGNLPAIRWLRASHCFNWGLDGCLELDNKHFIRFETKPLEELPSV